MERNEFLNRKGLLGSENLHGWDQADVGLASGALSGAAGENLLADGAAATWSWAVARKASSALAYADLSSDLVGDFFLSGVGDAAFGSVAAVNNGGDGLVFGFGDVLEHGVGVLAAEDAAARGEEETEKGQKAEVE